MRDWVAWHEEYERAGSPLQRRLEVVQRRLGEALDGAPDADIRSLDVTAPRVRGGDLQQVPALARAHAQRPSRWWSLMPASPMTYRGAVPADLVVACGVFGNISDQAVFRTIDALPGLCGGSATVVWTRHRRAPDLTP